MAAEAVQVIALIILLYFTTFSTQDVLPKAALKIGQATFKLTKRTWVYKEKGYTYSINLFQPLKGCSGATVCKSPATNLGKTYTSSLSADSSGFSLNFTDGDCDSKAHSKLMTILQFRCGKYMGSPVLLDEFTTDSECVKIFEFVTNEACKTSLPPIPEVPCYVYNGSKKIDLTPLIKTKGGHQVTSDVKGHDFYINVCRDITPDPKGATAHCPSGAGCRTGSPPISIGTLSAGSVLKITTGGKEIAMTYNSTKIEPACKGFASTKITFVCPNVLGQVQDKGPVMTATENCAYEVFWETEYACPQADVMSNNSCILSNEFVDFDLTPLQQPDGHNYRVQHKKYTYYVNVCKATKIPNCSPTGHDAVCQEISDTNQVFSLGDYDKQTLSYIDGQLVLSYKNGKSCSSGFRRETIINFKCNPLIEKGHPIFSGELIHCVYFFDWETKYACPPSRRTGSACRASRNGTRYDLTELISGNGTNWLAIDGESSSSSKMIYINICGRLNKETATSKCNVNSAACLIDKKDGTVKNLGRYLTPPTLNPDNSLTLNYTDGDECIKGVQRRTVVTLMCSHGDRTSPPVLVSHSQDNCVYNIMWKTSIACPLGIKQGDNCKVDDKVTGNVFDFSAMQVNQRLGHFYSTARKDKYTYYLKICKNLNDSAISACANAGACQSESINSKAVYRKMGKANSKLFYYDGILKLMYSDGDACHNGQLRQTHISFMCKPDATFQGDGVPEFVQEDHCIYHFRWPTKFACPAQVVECAVRSNNQQYDLSSLAKTDDNWNYAIDKLGQKGKLYINVCRSLSLNPSVRQCYGSSAVCFIGDNKDVLNLGQVEGALNVTAPGTITITYTKGGTCSKKGQPKQQYQSEIMFICKKGASNSGPSLKSIDNGGCFYKFRWETSAACAITNVVGANCTVKDPNSDTVFNLYPLSRASDNPYVITMLTGRIFTLNICEKVHSSACSKDEGVDVGVCMKETDKTLLNIGVVNQRVAFEGETVVLTYRDGDRDVVNGYPRISKIRFYCDPSVPLGSPKYIEQASTKDGEVFYFDFKTSLVCAAAQVQCQFKSSDNDSYDLSPLGLITGNWEAVDTRPQHNHLHYLINVCRPVNTVTSSPIQCPFAGVGATQIDHSVSRCFNLGNLQSSPSLVSKNMITLHYYGGSTCHGKYQRSTRINLSCAKYSGSPVFETETAQCEYVFSWQTPSACPLTREAGTNCIVTDRQYGYNYDLTSLSGKPFAVSVSGGVVRFGVCSNMDKICKGTNDSACFIKTGGAKVPSKDDITLLGKVTTSLYYYDQEITLRYHNDKCSLLIRFECDSKKEGAGDGPKYESKDSNCNYILRWSTNLACRPNGHVQCSVRTEGTGGKPDLQYDFTGLMKAIGNWKATTTSSKSSFFINVCRPVVKTGDASNCPETAGVCKIETTSPGHKSHSSLGQLTGGPVVKGNSIYLNYSGGHNCLGKSGKQASTLIRMECGPNAEAAPFKINDDACTYQFVWTTKYACPINAINQTISNDCTAVNPITNYKFDLNKLTNKIADYKVRDNNGHYFLINVCQALKKNTPCGKDSGSCQFTSDGSTSFNAGNNNKQLAYQDGVLRLIYTGGKVCQHSKTARTTIISFVCNRTSSSDLGKPVFVAESDDCTYYISWHSKLACERKVECSPLIADNQTNTKYRVRKLANDDHNWLAVSADGTKMDSTYYINICKALVPMKGINCPADASACAKIKDGSVMSLGRAGVPMKVNNGVIIVSYVNGTKNAQTRIELTCNHGDLGKPMFVSKDNNLYSFTWSTSAACIEEETVDIQGCRVYDKSTEFYYDVSSLKPTNGYITLPYADGKIYASVCGSLSLTGCSGAGVCRAPTKGNKQALGLYNSLTMTYIYDDNMLIMKYCDPKCDSAKYISRIMFICDETTTANNKYSLDSIDSYGVNIIWRTNLVCPPVQQQCVFNDNGHLYDLQLLSSRNRSWHYITTKGDKYWFNICRGVNDQSSCPRSATVCAQLGQGNTMLVLGYGKTQSITKSTPSDKQILVQYTGQTKIPVCTKQTSKARVMFQLICGQHVGKPKLYHLDALSCTFTFRWTTIAACQVQRRTALSIMSNCHVNTPQIGQVIDFSKLDKGPIKVNTFTFRICHKLPPSFNQCANKWVCNDGQAYDTTPKLYYEDYIFELWFVTQTRDTFIINFQCDESVPIGTPIFEYISGSFHHVYTWSTSVVCLKDQSGVIIDTVKTRSSSSSAGTKAGIAFAVIAVLLIIAGTVFVLHNRRRRQSLVLFVQANARRIRRKTVSGNDASNAVYKYQKVTADNDEDDVDLLLGFSDDEEDGGDEHNRQVNDDEMITL